jgi:hypothetical protein
MTTYLLLLTLFYLFPPLIDDMISLWDIYLAAIECETSAMNKVQDRIKE